MEAMECITGRSSIRAYSEDAIPKDAIGRMVSAACSAPSAGNAQDWEFIAVTDPPLKRKLSEASMGQKAVLNAPLVIVVCSDLDRISSYGERGTSLYSIQDTAAAAENLMLAAWDMGIGSCWIGGFNEQAVKEALVIPTSVRPLALITLGYPLASPKKPARKHRGIHWDRWE